VTAVGDDWQVTERGGRTWTVGVTAYADGVRPESCGKESKPVIRYAATLIA
jgi:hypothetical protein